MIMLILITNAIIGAIQEGRAKNILESLEQFIKTQSTVIRDGTKKIVEDVDLVPGDLIFLEEGAKVPADCRLIQSSALTIDEASLTGESIPVEKTADVIEAQGLGPVDQKNMVFVGTYVVSGKAKAVVVATGKHTQMGKMGVVIEEIDTASPFQVELSAISRLIIMGSAAIFTLLFIIGLILKIEITELITMLVSLLVSIIPEGLPIVSTIVLAMGAYRLARLNVLVKKLHAVEGLGRVQAILIDKTGTLTRNEQMVCQVYANSKMYRVTGIGYAPEGAVFDDGRHILVEEASSLWNVAVACCLFDETTLTFDSKQNRYELKGEPINAAVGVFAQKMGLHKNRIKQEYPVVHEIPFDPDQRIHGLFCKHKDRIIGFFMGSPELVLARCADNVHQYEKELTRMLSQGLRLVGLAMGEFLATKTEFSLQEAQNLSFLALIGMQDSIREDLQKVIDQVKKSGFHLAMITGDHPQTAVYVAKEVGLYKPNDNLMTEADIYRTSKDDFLSLLDSTTVFARITPGTKMDIVSAYQKRGNIVAMTGDGINDVPSILAADIGIAMGQMGTEVTKRAADIVLLDDSLQSIVDGISEGRHIVLTMRRVILYLLATSLGEVLTIAGLILLLAKLPLLAVQILWINLVTDGFLVLALAMEVREDSLLDMPWFFNLRLIDYNFLLKMLYMASLMALGSILVFFIYGSDFDKGRTAVFMTLCLFQWFNALNLRSEFKSFFSIPFFSNRWLIVSLVIVSILGFASVYLPILQKTLSTVPLSLVDWAVILAISSTIFFGEEIRKYVQINF